VDWTQADQPRTPQTDALMTPAALARWGRRLGVLAGRRLPAVDEDELEAARALRLAIYRIFSALAQERAPGAADLDCLARVHAQAAADGQLAPADDDAWRMEWRPADPRRIRFAVAVDAVALLGDPARLARVHRCPGPACGWLFLDTSGRRRWCSMSTCGSRVKMRRLYERRRQAEPRK
jgi:predicted RNA-binding Zn ribbon-like protein